MRALRRRHAVALALLVTVSIGRTADADSSFTVEEPEGGILELGDVPAGQTTPAGTVRLRSDGTEPLRIAAVRACASTTIVDGMRPPFDLAPGEAASWSVTCTPALPGVHAGCLEVESNHSTPVVTIGVRCRGLGGILRIGVAGVDLGDVLVGSSATVALPVENDCRRSTAPVTIRGLTTTSARFAATVRDRALPVTVEPCQSVLVDVTFTPADGRRERSTLIIESDGVEPVTTAWLGGDGATSGPDLQPSALDFGEVAVGASSASLFELSNPTTQPATIEAITIDPPGTFQVTGPAPGDVLGPRWAMNLAMEAAPVAPGHHAATATVTFDVLPDVSTRVSAIGVAPGLGVITWDETPGDGMLDLGARLLSGGGSTARVTLANSGTAVLHIDTCTLIGDGAFELATSCPLVIAPGATSDIAIAFAPDAEAMYDATLTVASDAFGAGTLAMPITATAVEPAISVSTLRLDLGEVVIRPRVPAVQTLSIHNPGSARLALRHIASDSVAFSLLADPPMTLDPGASVALPIAFAPTALGEIRGLLRIEHGAGVVEVILVGTGIDRRLEVAPTVIDIGEIRQGSVRRASDVLGHGVLVSNVDARAWFVLTTLQIDGDDGVRVLPPADSVIAPGETREVDIEIEGLAAGDRQATVSLFVDGEAAPQATVLVRARVVAGDGGCASAGGGGAGSAALIAALAVLAARRRRPTWWLALGLAAAGCGSGSGDPDARVDAATPAALEVRRNGAVVTAWDFGAVAMGVDREVELAIVNVATGTTGVVRARIDADVAGAFEVVRGTCLDRPSMASGESCSVVIRCRGTASGPWTATLAIDAGVAVSAGVELRGRGVAGPLVLELDSVTLGPVAIGSDAVAAVRVVNGGDSPLSIHAVAVEGAGFALAARGCPDVLPAAAEGTCEVSIRFTPSAIGNATGTVVITTSVGVVRAPLSAAGAGRVAVVKAGTGSGAVSSLPAGIECGATCDASFSSAVILDAVPDPGSIFLGWSAPCAGRGPCVVTPSAAPLTVAATFAPLHRLTITATGDGAGEVTVDDVVCPLPCSRVLVEGASVHLHAYTPSAFGGWSGACAGPDPACTLVVSTDLAASPSFVRDDGEAWSSTLALTPQFAALADDGDVVVGGYDASSYHGDAVVTRVGPADQVRWTRRFPGPLGAHVTGVAVRGDAAFVLIESRSDAPRAGTVQLTKLGVTGVEEWSKPFTGDAFDPATGLQDNQLIVALPDGGVAAYILGTTFVLGADGAQRWTNVGTTLGVSPDNVVWQFLPEIYTYRVLRYRGSDGAPLSDVRLPAPSDYGDYLVFEAGHDGHTFAVMSDLQAFRILHLDGGLLDWSLEPYWPAFTPVAIEVDGRGDALLMFESFPLRKVTPDRVIRWARTPRRPPASAGHGDQLLPHGIAGGRDGQAAVVGVWTRGITGAGRSSGFVRVYDP